MKKSAVMSKNIFVEKLAQNHSDPNDKHFWGL